MTKIIKENVEKPKLVVYCHAKSVYCKGIGAIYIIRYRKRNEK